MKIAAYSIGDINRASSRLRSFYLFSSAKNFNLDVIRPVRFRDAFGVDLVHIQKRLSYKILLAVIVYRILCIKVIFDIDDQPGGLKSFLGYLSILMLSTVVTVDTEARKKYWKKYLFFKKILVINDVADSKQSELKIVPRISLKNNINYFWLGHSSNLPSLNGFIQLIKATSESKLIVSIEEGAIGYWNSKYPFIKFLPWFDAVAFDPSIDATFMVLNHKHDKASLLKSDNKMVLALLAGFVPIVSRTPAYENLAKLLKADFLVYDNVEDIPSIAMNVAKMDLNKFFSDSLIFINSNYSRESVLREFSMSVICL
jgi:hypothetical protein